MVYVVYGVLNHSCHGHICPSLIDVWKLMFHVSPAVQLVSRALNFPRTLAQLCNVFLHSKNLLLDKMFLFDIVTVVVSCTLVFKCV